MCHLCYERGGDVVGESPFFFVAALKNADCAYLAVMPYTCRCSRTGSVAQTVQVKGRPDAGQRGQPGGEEGDWTVCGLVFGSLFIL